MALTGRAKSEWQRRYRKRRRLSNQERRKRREYQRSYMKVWRVANKAAVEANTRLHTVASHDVVATSRRQLLALVRSNSSYMEIASRLQPTRTGQLLPIQTW